MAGKEASMGCSRRDLALLIPALVGVSASAQTPAAGPQRVGDAAAEPLPVMATKAYRFADLEVATTGKNRQRRMFTAQTHTGFKIESHQSDIAPGEVNHPPHQHLREEMMLIREGTMELTISGKPYRLGPGDVGVIGSNELDNAKNVGT